MISESPSPHRGECVLQQTAKRGAALESNSAWSAQLEDYENFIRRSSSDKAAATRLVALNLPRESGDTYQVAFLNPELERAMTTKRIVRQSLITAAVLSALTLAGVLSASAESNVYKDISKPNGHERSSAIKLADSRACGADRQRDLPPDIAGFNACMYAHGWMLDHVIEDRQVFHDGNDHDIYDNIAKQARGDAAAQVDGRFCTARFGATPNGTETSSAFKQCMLGRGWRFSSTQRAPTAPNYARRQPAASDSFEAPPPGGSRIDDAIQQIWDQENAATVAASAAASDATAALATMEQQLSAGQ
jgi:hypothetical protein